MTYVGFSLQICHSDLVFWFSNFKLKKKTDYGLRGLRALFMSALHNSGEKKYLLCFLFCL